MVESVPAKAWPRKTEAISARIIPWTGDTLGVAYDFPDGKHTAQPIEADDWPIIRTLEDVGRLTYSSDAVRIRAAEFRQ